MTRVKKGEIDILPYKLKEDEKDSHGFVYSCDSEGIYYIPKNYNGVADVFYSQISLLGNKNDTDVIKWIDSINHEFLHIIIFELGIKDKQIHEHLIDFLLS